MDLQWHSIESCGVALRQTPSHFHTQKRPTTNHLGGVHLPLNNFTLANPTVRLVITQGLGPHRLPSLRGGYLL